MNQNFDIVTIFVPFRLIGFFLTLLIFTLYFRTVLIHVDIATGHITKAQNIGVCFLQILCMGNHKKLLILIQHHFCPGSDGARTVERLYLFLIRLTVVKLFADLLHCAVPPVGEPR